MYRHHPLWQRTHELVTEGAIGELLAIQARFTYHNLDPTTSATSPSTAAGR